MSRDMHSEYFVPQPSGWPIVASLALLFVVSGAASWVNDGARGPWVLAAGAAILAFVLIGWFGTSFAEGPPRRVRRSG